MEKKNHNTSWLSGGIPPSKLCGNVPPVSWEMRTLSSAVFHHCKKSSSQDHRCLICVIESMAFLWTWQLKWVDSSLLLGSIPSPYGEPNGFLGENSWIQGRIRGWQVSGEDRRIMFVKENQGNRKISLLCSFFGTQLASLHTPYCGNRCFGSNAGTLAATLGHEASNGIC